ncbi:16S rRNA (cytosine(967)-C(5))-methyltransferase [hydrothermal vent metagenome]|uniref:16S rRNA (cytosine(967)-C(5))-methyltransferase n=1 Tax=hydrothermal vent metagenome TaxID=652676 RepID=A0A3B1AE92_9ZZZZ
MNPRLTAHHVLSQVIVSGHSLDFALQKHNTAKDPKHRALISAICFGVCRWLPKLEAILAQLVNKPLRKKDQDIEILLYIGLYQLFDMRIAEHAIVSETVTVCKKLRKMWSKNLVNGVLRQFLREKDAIVEKVANSLSGKSAHPEWLAKHIQQAWPEQADAIFAANNTQAPMSLRVNSSVCNVEQYLEQLHDNGKQAQATSLSTVGITLDKACDVKDLPNFYEGYFSVQDEAPQLAAILLDAQTGERVLDACAAPGGKTCHIVEQQADLTECVALDISVSRLTKIQENLTRLKLNANIIEGDAATPDSWWDGKQFDRILLDAPCSATGVIRRHPDIKILRREQDISALVATQQQILQSLWPLLKPGGMLLYCTCSILPIENTELIEKFIQQTDDAVEKKIDAEWGLAQPVGRQILPSAIDTSNMDGFYYAHIYKE